MIPKKLRISKFSNSRPSCVFLCKILKILLVRLKIYWHPHNWTAKQVGTLRVFKLTLFIEKKVAN